MLKNSVGDKPSMALRRALMESARKAIQASPLKARELSEKTGVSQTLLSKISKGHAHGSTSVDMLYDACGKLGVMVTVSISE